MRDVLAILVAALFGAAIPLLYWLGERARVTFLPLDSPLRTWPPILKGWWLALAAFMAVIFAWTAFERLHAALALQVSFIAWALGGGCLAVAAPWLVWRTRWLRVPQGRSFNALGRLVMLLFLESLAATICTADLRDWFPSSPAAPALQSAVVVTSTIFFIVFIALMPLAMLGLLSQRVHIER